MTQSTRILIALIIVVIIVGAVLGIDTVRRQRSPAPLSETQVTLTPGSVPIYLDGRLVGGFTPGDLSRLEKVSFIDAAEGKNQEGWLLRDVLMLYIQTDTLKPNTVITVSSASRTKSAQLSWAEVAEPANMVMFDLSNRGTLKLVSLLDKLDMRDEWVQDVDKIEVTHS